MLYELGKKLFEFIDNALKFIQVFLIFLSFFVILYWLLQLGGATYLGPVAPFFEAIKNFTHLFYQRTVTVDEVTIDFSFLIAALAFLLVVWILRFIIEDVELVEEKYDSFYKSYKEKAEKLFNAGLERQYVIHEHRNNKFMFYVKVKAVNLAKNSMFNSDSMVGVDEKEQEVLAEFVKKLEENFRLQKRFMHEGFLLYFNKFEDIDNVIFHIESIVSSQKIRCKADKWQVRFYMSIEPYSDDKDLILKAKNLFALAKLGLSDEIVSLGSLKQRYDLVKNPKCVIEGRGVYKVEIGEEEVFRIKTL